MDKVATKGTAFVETEHRVSGESMGIEYEEKHLEEEIVVDKDKMAEIQSKIGMTISLGGYEFLRVDSGVTLPCEKSKIKQAQQEAFDLAGEELFKRIEEARKTII